MSKVNIDPLITSLNNYLNIIYSRIPLVIQADNDQDTLNEPYATVQRTTEAKPGYQETRISREFDVDGIVKTNKRNDRYGLIFQTYGSNETGKQLSEDIFNWFQFVAETTEGITVRSLTDVIPGDFVIAKQTVKTFVFTATIEEEISFDTKEESIEGIEVDVN